MIRILNYGGNKNSEWAVKGEEENKKFLAAWCSYNNKDGQEKEMFVPISQYIENPKDLENNPEVGITMTRTDKLVINKVKEQGNYALVYIDLQAKNEKIADVTVDDNTGIFLYRLIGREIFIALVKFEDTASSKIEILAQTSDSKGTKYTVTFEKGIVDEPVDSNVSLVPIYIAKFHPGTKHVEAHDKRNVRRDAKPLTKSKRHKVFIGAVESTLREGKFVKKTSLENFNKNYTKMVVQDETNIYVGAEMSDAHIVDNVIKKAEELNAKVYLSTSNEMGFNSQYRRVK